MARSSPRWSPSKSPSGCTSHLQPPSRWETSNPSFPLRCRHSARMRRMRVNLSKFIFLLACAYVLAGHARAQSAMGSLDFAASVTPTAARPEPVREFTFYLLTKSYAEIVKDVEAQNVVPPRDKFIEGLTVSPELKDWLKAHAIFDITTPEMDKLVTPD